MPDFIAVWLPLILGTLRKPAASPTMTPPGKLNLGMDCKPPSFKARAPYAIRLPSVKSSLIAGCVLNC